MKKIIAIVFLIIIFSQTAMAGFNGYLKADTQVIVTIGPFVDVGDGFTPQTDIALSGNEAELLKHGSTSVVDISGATWAAVTNCRGYYSLTLTTGHTDTEGQLTVVVQDDSDCLPVRNTFMVVNANVFDSLFAAATTDYLQVDTIQVTGTSQTANDNGADINAILTDTGAYDSDAEYAEAIWGAAVASYNDEADFGGELGGLDPNLAAVLVDTSTTLDDFIDTEIATLVSELAETDANVAIIRTDTEAMDTSTELRTLLTGADAALPTAAELAETDANVALVLTDTAAYDTDAEHAEAIWGAAVASYNDEADFGGELGGLDPNLAAVLVDTSTTLDDFIDTEIATLVSELAEADANVALILADTAAQDTASEMGTLVWGNTTERALTEFDEDDMNDIDIDGVTLEGNVKQILGTAVTETNAGDVAESFTFFFDVDPVTSKTVDDVGAVASGGGSELAINAGNLGDYKESATVYFIWRTIDQGGAAVNPSTAGTVRVYKNNGTGQVTAPTGITDTRGFDSLTGIHLCAIDLSANSFYATDQDYSVVLTGATIDSQSVSAVIGTFSIEKRWTEEFWDYAG